MKIAMFTSYDAGGTQEVAFPIAEELRKQGHEVKLEAVGRGHAVRADPTLVDFDIAHFWNIEEMKHFEPSCPTVATIHHIPVPSEYHYRGMISKFSPNRIHVVDKWTRRQLGRWGITNVTWIPQAIDTSKWKPLPLPETFTVGYMGDPMSHKRFGVIEAAAEKAGVPCIGLLSDPWKTEEERLAFFGAISCYVVASFEDGGPVPALEALLCGRPVVTTHVGQMDDIIVDKDNGYFHDGSVEDCAKKILYIKEDIGWFEPALDATQDISRNPDEMAQEYIGLYESLLES